ncbi:calcium-binding protein [Celeribacter sp.]|uniref:calcium-binding protein n=1 Tax=Celeribacter sp. TaxID=1890673 RepID=UPI003A8CFC6C
MLWALAILGVLPAAFLFGDENDAPDEGAVSDDAQPSPAKETDADNSSESIDFFLNSPTAALRGMPFDVSEDDTSEEEVIEPNDPDVAATPGPTGSEDDSPTTSTDPETEAFAGPAGSDEDDVLLPNAEDDNVTGDLSGETVNYILDDDGDELVLPDDRQQGGTDATFAVDEGGATLTTEGTLNIVEGGAGDDTVGLGDDAAIAFGNAGNDALYAGDGSAILNGGEGDDTLVAGQDAQASYYLEGGEGTDTFVMEFDSAVGQPTIEIAEFDPLVDVITIEVDAVTAASGPVDLSVAQTDDGLSSEIVINEVVVATVTGIANLDPNIIVLSGV